MNYFSRIDNVLCWNTSTKKPGLERKKYGTPDMKKKERKAQGLTFLRVLARAKPDCATTESVTLYCFGLFYPNSVHLNTLAELHLSGDLVTKLTVLHFFCNFAPLNQ